MPSIDYIAKSLFLRTFPVERAGVEIFVPDTGNMCKNRKRFSDSVPIEKMERFPI